MLDSFPLMVPDATSDRQATVWAPYDGAEIATVAGARWPSAFGCCVHVASG